jgi:signal peptide peptidase SppA
MSDEATHEREADRYPQIVRAVRETPWAILPGTLATILDVVGRRLDGERLTQEEIQERVGDRSSASKTGHGGLDRVIPIAGVIIPKATLFSEISGGTSVDSLQADFRDALGDDSVKAIVLDVDSPGGMTTGIQELAAEIRAARGTKPIVAVANYRAASAAYHLASQADELVASPSADVGSIGVFAAHEEVSGMQEKLGVKTTLIAEPAGKIAGNPLRAAERGSRGAHRGGRPRRLRDLRRDVAKGRGVTTATVKSDYGQGRMLSAPKALKAGMIDRIDTLESVVAKLQNPSGRSRAASGNTASGHSGDSTVTVTLTGDSTALTQSTGFTDAVDEAHRAFEAVVSGAEALRALTGTKREQLAALIERGQALLAQADEPEEAEAHDDELELELALAEADARLRL